MKTKSDKINSRIKPQKIQSLFIRSAVYFSVGITVIALVFILGYIFAKGIPHITPELFSIKYTSENVSLMPALINTIFITVLALLIAAPIGIFSAIYLSEYAKSTNKLVSIVRTTTETLSGIPSIVYGLFGYLLFVIAFGWGPSLIGGALTLSVMILPLIMRTTEEALKAAPVSYREASFGLGAGKLRTIFKIVLPAASPGILSGIILSIGRIVGETAALIYTSGTVAEVADGLNSSARTLSIHMYSLWKEGFHEDQAYATAVILIILVIGLNALSSAIGKRISKGQNNG